MCHPERGKRAESKDLDRGKRPRARCEHAKLFRKKCYFVCIGVQRFCLDPTRRKTPCGLLARPPSQSKASLPSPLASASTHRFAVVAASFRSGWHGGEEIVDYGASNVLGYAEHADMPFHGNRGTSAPTGLCERCRACVILSKCQNLLFQYGYLLHYCRGRRPRRPVRYNVVCANNTATQSAPCEGRGTVYGGGVVTTPFSKHRGCVLLFHKSFLEKGRGRTFAKSSPHRVSLSFTFPPRGGCSSRLPPALRSPPPPCRRGSHA